MLPFRALCGKVLLAVSDAFLGCMCAVWKPVDKETMDVNSVTGKLLIMVNQVPRDQVLSS